MKHRASTGDVLGLPERASCSSPDDGRVTILEAGTATLELANFEYAAYIDQLEVGSRVAGAPAARG
jgi:lactoylglutathione lyase